MTITSFNPLIVTKDAEATIALFEALGFERAHTKTGISHSDVTSIDLKYGEDFRVDVATVDKFPQDMTVIRMNVRDFDEAYDFLVSKGFKNAAGDEVTIRITGNGFLYNMVRIITGTLLRIGQGLMEPDDMKEILDRKLPAWAAVDGLEIPSALALEQCSSSATWLSAQLSTPSPPVRSKIVLTGRSLSSNPHRCAEPPMKGA